MYLVDNMAFLGEGGGGIKNVDLSYWKYRILQNPINKNFLKVNTPLPSIYYTPLPSIY